MFITKVVAESLLLFVTVILTLTKSTDGLEKLSKYQKVIAKWGGLCQRAAGQSPINIVDRETIRYNKYDPLMIVGLDEKQRNVSLINYVSGAAITDFADKILVYGGPLSGKFIVDHIDFVSLSEHTIDGVQYQLECEIICFNENYADGYDEALNEVNGIIVLSVLYHSSENDNESLNDILAAISKMKNYTTTSRKTILDKFRLRQVLPHIGPYYTYTGSLTKPRCNDGVTWIVFRKSYPIHWKQLEIFQSIEFQVNTPIGHNFRFIQPTANRTVVLSEKSFFKSKDRAAHLTVSNFVCFMSLSLLKVFHMLAERSGRF